MPIKKFEYMRLYVNARWRENHTEHHLLRVYGVNDETLESEIDLIPYLNELGREGWEVISMIEETNLLLKREISG